MSNLVVRIVTTGNSRVNDGGRKSNCRPVASNVRLMDDELGKMCEEVMAACLAGHWLS
jgi:hypothetical protein